MRRQLDCSSDGIGDVGKDNVTDSTHVETKCPYCGSERLYRDGLRYLKDGSGKQRWLCRSCGYRFSELNVTLDVGGQLVKGSDPTEDHTDRRIARLNSSSEEVLNSLSFDGSEEVGSHNVSTIEKDLNGLRIYNREHQLCVKKAKKLDTATDFISVAGEKSQTLEKLPQNAKGLIAQFLAYLEKEGYAKESHYPHNLKTLVNLGANLLDPESVKQVLGRHNIKNGAKLQHVYAYSAFAKMLKISWDPPRYKQEETLPFIPEEVELDQLVAACKSKRMAAYLQTLKETYADPGEALRLRWIDISGNVITINKPVKGHLPRQLEVTPRLIAMLDSLPKISERIFPTDYRTIFSCYDRVRKRAAEIQKNPRLLSIQLRTFRHWGGTMIAYYTNGNVLTVKKLLGHKRIENTMKYIGLVHFKDDQFEVATATTVEEAKTVISAGFEYVTEKSGIMLFRKPKRFSKYG